MCIRDRGKGVGHTHQLHMAEQGSLGASGHGGIGPVRKGCHGHADGGAVAGQGDGVVAVRGHSDGNQQPILGRLGGEPPEHILPGLQIPVSYTHLDVYKRQPRRRRRRPPPS